MRLDYIDYPTGHELARIIGYGREAHLHPDCSAVHTHGAVLCDCGAIAVEWGKRGGRDWQDYVPASCRKVAGL